MDKKNKVKKFEYIILILAVFLIVVLFLVFSFNDKEIKKSPNFSIEDKTSRINNALLENGGNFEVRLDVPNYLDKSLAYPQKFFSGRKIRIINGINNLKIAPDVITFVERDINTRTAISSYEINGVKKTVDGFTIEIPRNTKTGFYTLEFQESNKIVTIPITIFGIEQDEVFVDIPNTPLELNLGVSKFLGCNCYWESVLAINPLNENFGYVVGSGSTLAQTIDGWNTWNRYIINDITNPLLREYLVDPKTVFDSSNRLILASLFWGNQPVHIIGGLYNDISQNVGPPHLIQTILQYEAQNLPDYHILFDYPKIAIDNYPSSPYFNSKYIFANSVFFEDTQTWATGLFIMRDGQITKHKTTELGNGDFVQPPNSALVGPNGIIFAGRVEQHEIFVHVSLDGGHSFVKRTIQSNLGLEICPAAKVSTSSNRVWFVYTGPELAVDHNGRIYAAWAEYKECITDPDFEYEKYAVDYDVYVSFSDNNGITWNNPTRVNDDFSYGHQVFPSIFVDEDNIVYVTFLDHRDRQEEALYDIYLTHSIDRGQSFSRNIRLNEISVPNVEGGREPGDYLDMIRVGQNNIFVLYPCLDRRFAPPYYHANDACIRKLPKPLEYILPMPTNPSFEVDSGIDYYPNWNGDDRIANNNLPDGFRSLILQGTGSVTLDDQFFYNGYRSISININNPGRGASWQDIPIDYNKKYMVSGYVRTACFDNNCYGTILSECADVNHATIWGYNNCKLNINPVDIDRKYGTTQWTRIQFEVLADNPNARFLRVLCYNSPGPLPVGSGIVWCDSFNVIEIPRGPVGSPLFLKARTREFGDQ